MAGGIGVFRPECRPKGIYIFKCLGEGLTVELAAHGKVGLFSKEILGIVNSPFRSLRQVLHVQCRNPEHLSGALTVAAGDQRRMHVNKFPFLEKFMNRIGDQ